MEESGNIRTVTVPVLDPVFFVDIRITWGDSGRMPTAFTSVLVETILNIDNTEKDINKRVLLTDKHYPRLAMIYDT